MISLLVLLYLSLPGTDSLSTVLSKTTEFDNNKQQEIIRLKQDADEDYECLPVITWFNIQHRWQPTEWVHVENLLGYARYSGPQTMWQFVAITGKLLIQRSGKGKTKMDVHLPAGIYLIKTGDTTQKLIIK